MGNRRLGAAVFVLDQVEIVGRRGHQPGNIGVRQVVHEDLGVRRISGRWRRRPAAVIRGRMPQMDAGVRLLSYPHARCAA